MKKFIKLTLLILFYHYQALGGIEHIIAVNPVIISKGDFHQKYIAVGQVKLADSQDYFAKIDGMVDFVIKNQGTALDKDTTLLIIDKDIAEKLKAQTEAKLFLAESNYNRDVQLLRKKITSEEGSNTSKAAYETAKKDYADALKSYDNMVIKAPGAGYVGVIKTNVGDEIKKGDYLFSFINKSDFYIFVEMPEVMKGKVLTTDKVSIKSKDEVIEGRISAISDYVSNTGTVTAKLDFPYSASLSHGSFVEAEIIFNNHEAIAIPEKAVLKNNQGDFVYLITSENIIKQVFVKLGVRTNDLIELVSGDLKEGDTIVIEGLTKVHDGAQVKINTVEDRK